MRRISISHKDGSKIEVYDESDNDLDEFCNDLSKLLVFNNITILKTSSSITILRPSQIQSIHVSEHPDHKKETKLEVPEINISTNKKKSKSKIIEDIITDK